MLFEPIFEHARATPDAIAVIDDHGRYTYQQVATMAAGLGLFLGTQTQQPRIGILLPAGVGFVVSFYGTLLAGKGVVPINFLLGDREVRHVIADSGVDTILTIPQLATRLQGTPIKVIDITALPKPTFAIEPDFPSRTRDDVAVLMYTSGTSALPKGVMLTYENLQSDVDASIEYANLKPGHRFLGVIPLFHAFGMTAMMLAPLQLGATVIYTARFSPAGAVQLIREHKVSIMFGVPSMFGAILHLKNASPEDFASFYAIITGGEALPKALRDGFSQRFNTQLYEGYGLTETSPVLSLNTPDVHRHGSVGKPIPGVEVRVANDDGMPVGTGEEGELWVRGPMIMKGYYNLPDETSKSLTPDGFFKTGDLGKVDADGFMYVTGRKKDLIIVAGEKAVPREIEECLLHHPAVLDAAVLGKKDPSRGEVVVAFVVAKEGQTADPDELRDFCRKSGLAPFKLPREITVLPEFPRSPTGKILKRTIAEQYLGATPSKS